jgi:hypothetical protein
MGKAMSRSKSRAPGGARSAGGYTTVNPQGTPHYVAPHQPDCPMTLRYMAVHRVVGGGWGIVDRRTGRLLGATQPTQHRYRGWDEVQTAVQGLNAPAPR